MNDIAALQRKVRRLQLSGLSAVEGEIVAGNLQGQIVSEGGVTVDTGFKAPTNLISTNWSGGFAIADINASDDVRTSHLGTTYEASIVNNFEFPDLTGKTIEGFEVTCEFGGGIHGNTGYLKVYLSWDNGSTWTAAKSDTSIAEAVVTFGGPTDLWGRTWLGAECNDGTFQVMVEGKGESAITRVYLDCGPLVKIYYQDTSMSMFALT